MSNNQETNRKETPWRDNSSFVTTFYAILTAMVGAFLALAIGDKEIATVWYCPIGLLALSMISFIWGLERCGEAMDEDDIDKYLAWLLVYNFGTIAMFFGVATYISMHYHVSWTLFFFLLLVALVASWKWVDDIRFLIFASDADSEKYRAELLGNRLPQKQLGLVVRLYGFCRKMHTGKVEESILPDTRSYTRLRPSQIHGVGVFAIRNIPKGLNIFSDDDSQMIWIDKKIIQARGGEIRRLYDDFCVLRKQKYGCPKGFNNLTIGWYLNQPLKGQKPNVECDDNYDFIATRDISEGEELTVDYSTFSDNPTTGR
jgi:hypothetical protein